MPPGFAASEIVRGLVSPTAMTVLADGRIRLEAGRRYPVVLEMHDVAGPALVRLLWSGPGTPRQVVPAVRLFPAGSAQPPG